MVDQDYMVTLKRAAQELDIPEARLARLARVLKVSPNDPCLPGAIVNSVRSLSADPEQRYMALVPLVVSEIRERNNGG